MGKITMSIGKIIRVFLFSVEYSGIMNKNLNLDSG